MSSPLDSKAVNIPGCSVNGTFPAAANNNGTLHLVFPDTNNNLNITSNQISKILQARTGLGQWSAPVVLATLFPGANDLAFQTKGAPAIVAFGEYNYIFWADTKGQLGVVRCLPDGSRTACATLTFQLSRGQVAMLTPTATLVASNPVAIVTPDGSGISLQFLAQAQASFKQNGVSVHTGNSLWVNCLLSPDDFQPFAQWAVRYVVTPMDTTGTLASNYKAISAAWFTQGEAASPSSTNGSSPPEVLQTKYYQVVAAYSSHDKNALCYAWLVDMRGMPVTVTEPDGSDKPAPQVIDQTPVAITGIGGTNNSLARGVNIIRDPAGALTAYYCQFGSKPTVTAAVFSPNTVDKAGSQRTGLFSPAWSHARPVASITSNSRPCPVFVGLPVEHGKTPPVQPPNAAKPAQVFNNAAMQRQVLFVFYSATASSAPPYQLEVQTFFYGTSICLPQAVTLNPKQSNLMAVSLVADTFPYPVPDSSDANTGWNGSSPSGTIDWTGCTYEYLVGNQTETELVNEGWGAVGFQTAGGVTKGVGVVWDARGRIGGGGFDDTVNTSFNATVQSVSSKGVGLPGDTLGIRQQGALFGRSYPTLAQALSFFIDRDNKPVSSAAAPVRWYLYPARENAAVPVNADFPAYCYTPGNLLSYAPAQLNNRMSNLFKAPSTNTSDFKIGGENFSNFYLDTNKSYLDHVVDRFGAKCFGTDGKQSYLEFTFGSTESQRGQYQDTSQFSRAGSFFFDGALYIGVGGGAEASFLGMGEAFSWDAMIGAEMGYTLTKKNSTAKSWGISLSNFLNPLAPDEAYTVRMYFLKPSRLWGAELKNFAFAGASPAPQIDFANSAPVRFLFTVPYISQALSTRLSTAAFTAPPASGASAAAASS